jgi:hypothetical protein
VLSGGGDGEDSERIADAWLRPCQTFVQVPSDGSVGYPNPRIIVCEAYLAERIFHGADPPEDVSPRPAFQQGGGNKGCVTLRRLLRRMSYTPEENVFKGSSTPTRILPRGAISSIMGSAGLVETRFFCYSNTPSIIFKSLMGKILILLSISSHAPMPPAKEHEKIPHGVAAKAAQRVSARFECLAREPLPRLACCRLR